MSPGEDRAEGKVAAFDDDRGTGEVEATDGRRLFFHCTAIADGTRTIAPGSTVSFVVVPGHLGKWEAADLRPSQ